jgi:hypothetical protein
MTTTIDKTIETNPELSAAIQKAQGILEEVIGNTAIPATADWKIGNDERNKPVIELILSDCYGSVSRKFSAKELQKPDYLKGRLNWLWGDLLQIRSHKQAERLKELVRQLEDD